MAIWSGKAKDLANRPRQRYNGEKAKDPVGLFQNRKLRFQSLELDERKQTEGSLSGVRSDLV